MVSAVGSLGSEGAGARSRLPSLPRRVWKWDLRKAELNKELKMPCDSLLGVVQMPVRVLGPGHCMASVWPWRLSESWACARPSGSKAFGAAGTLPGSRRAWRTSGSGGLESTPGLALTPA